MKTTESLCSTRTYRPLQDPSRCWWRGWWWRTEDPVGGYDEVGSQQGVGTDMIAHPWVPVLSKQSPRPQPWGRCPWQRCQIPSMKTVKFLQARPGLVLLSYCWGRRGGAGRTVLPPPGGRSGSAQPSSLRTWEADRETEGARLDLEDRLTWDRQWKGQSFRLF